jgi:hypothetical protein
MRRRICISCSKKKSVDRFDEDEKTCKRCNTISPRDRQVEMKDLLIALEKIHTALLQIGS